MDATTTCPGCGLVWPAGERPYDRKFHASAECWTVYEEVLAREYGDAVLFGRVHQLTVDAYAVQHAGGAHPDKSVCLHLVGLCLVLERGVAPTAVPPLLRRLARRASWPRLAPPPLPPGATPTTVLDVARAPAPSEHAAAVRRWAESVWRNWTPHHGVARGLLAELG